MLARKLQKTEESRCLDLTPKMAAKLDFWERIYQIELDLTEDLKEFFIAHPSVVHTIYNPIEYAKGAHCDYLKKYLNGEKKILYLGMNPGPYGMCQTGVPFGDVKSVVNWMKVSGEISAPEVQHPKHIVVGFDLKRDEQSGKRLWGLLEDLFGEADNFFSFSGVYNLCPQGYFNKTGGNVTPADFKTEIRNEFIQICNKHLEKAIRILKPEKIVVIGRFVETCVRKLKDIPETQLIYMNHPSPRAVGNQNWVEKTKIWYKSQPVLLNKNESNLLDGGCNSGGEESIEEKRGAGRMRLRK